MQWISDSNSRIFYPVEFTVICIDSGVSLGNEYNSIKPNINWTGHAGAYNLISKSNNEKQIMAILIKHVNCVLVFTTQWAWN